MAPALPAFMPLPIRRRLASQHRLIPVLQRRCMARALAAVRAGDICYFWPGAPLYAMEQARARGGRIILEFINTHAAYAKAILDAECDRVGMPRYAKFTPAVLQHEADRVALADAIFAPGPFVERSIRETAPAVPQILPASYGAYMPSDPPRRIGAAGRPVRFLFVGSVGLRKGAHILLEAWRRAGLPAELWIAGSVEKQLAASGLQDKLLGKIPGSVRFLGHVPDIGAVYRDTDVFVFPSFEEGGPQVTYEAAAHGLPLIVTPMGGAYIARDGANAMKIPPADVDALAAALTQLHDAPDQRLAFGEQALADASHYAWDSVADRRRRALLDFAAPAP
jgi:glycosyltransferase involved in cell wall biosynthesis